MYLETLKESEYIKCGAYGPNCLAWMEIAKKIKKCFQRKGIKSFLQYLESVHLAPETSEKL